MAQEIALPVHACTLDVPPQAVGKIYLSGLEQLKVHPPHQLVPLMCVLLFAARSGFVRTEGSSAGFDDTSFNGDPGVTGCYHEVSQQ